MSAIVQIISENTQFEKRAKEIAGLLELDYPGQHGNAGLQLIVAEKGLSLGRIGSQQKSIAVDFASGKMTYRRAHGRLRSESIARAVGWKHNYFPHVVDATAGMGKDSFILAALGCDVTMLERSKVMALLLDDGLSRAALIEDLQPIVSLMKVVQVDAFEWLNGRQLPPDTVIYLDPMFPSSHSSALPSGEMQILQALLGKDEEVDRLFQRAKNAGPRRIVMKRPARAAQFAVKPDFSVKGKASRFDVFLNAMTGSLPG